MPAWCTVAAGPRFAWPRLWTSLQAGHQVQYRVGSDRTTHTSCIAEAEALSLIFVQAMSLA
jgi:hypothetical protein